MFNFFNKSDAEIEMDVINELIWDPSMKSKQVSVTSRDGIVTLTGSVAHYLEKSKAEQGALRVGGVRAVANELNIDMMGSYLRSDAQIAAAVLTSFEWNYSVPKGIKVVVDKGWVTLKGEVDWEYQRQAALESVGHLMGVHGVINNVSLKSAAQPSDIKLRIENALKRSAEIESRQIEVAIQGTNVVLSGKVHSHSESEEARQAAWNAPGVLSVENKITISQ